MMVQGTYYRVETLYVVDSKHLSQFLKQTRDMIAEERGKHLEQDTVSDHLFLSFMRAKGIFLHTCTCALIRPGRSTLGI